MEKLRKEAKLTQAKYGSNKKPAFLLKDQNLIMVIRIANQRKMISKKANKGECKPKNKKDQRIFKSS
jgi:hypothetical protein